MTDFLPDAPDIRKLISDLYGHQDVMTEPITPDGSARRYYRLKSAASSAVMCIYDNPEVNLRYIELSSLLYPLVNIPLIYSANRDLTAYIQQDLGEYTMSRMLERLDPVWKYPLYLKALNLLILFHKEGGIKIKDKDGYEADTGIGRECLKLFSEYFVPLIGKEPLPAGVTAEINELVRISENVGKTGLMMRDFQPRNIMHSGGRLFVIDFQDAVAGNIMYDLASLLSPGVFPPDRIQRTRLLAHFFKVNGIYQDTANTRKLFYVFTVLRRLRSLGTYAKLGAGEGKSFYRQRLLNAVPEFLLLEEEVRRYIEVPYLFKYLAQAEGRIAGTDISAG